MLDFIKSLTNLELQQFLWTAYEEANNRKLELPYQSHLSELPIVNQFNTLHERIDMMLNPQGYSDDPDITIEEHEDRDALKFLQSVVNDFEKNETV